MLCVAFPIYVAVTVFCVLNIITATFVEAAQRQAGDEETRALDLIRDRKNWIKDIRELYLSQVEDEDEKIGKQQFREIFRDPRTENFLLSLGLDVNFVDVDQMFALFDLDEDGSITVDEFGRGVHYLKGYARSLDIFRLLRMVKRTDKTISSMASTLERVSKLFGVEDIAPPVVRTNGNNSRRHGTLGGWR